MHKLLILIFCVLFISCSILSCVSPNAINADIASVKNNLSKLEDLQKNDSNILAERIEKIDNSLEQINTLLEGNIDVDGDINFGGAGWVVLGGFSLTLLFVVPIFILAKKLIEKNGLLKLTTCSVQKLPHISRLIKDQIEKETSNGSFPVQYKEKLADFTIKNGTFAHND